MPTPFKSVLILCTALTCLPLFSQDSLPPITHYTMRDGLSQMKTTSIVQDNLGYFWIGTRSGLNRFDGENIVSYFQKDGLLHDRIHALALNDDGHVVILTYRGVCIFNGSTFTNYKKDFLGAEYEMTIDANGLIWITSYDGTLILNNGQFIEVEIDGITSIISDKSNGQTYLISRNRIFAYKDDGPLQVLEGTFGISNGQMMHSRDPSLFIKETSPGIFQYCYFKNGHDTCLNSKESYLSFSPGTAIYSFPSSTSVTIQDHQSTNHFNGSPFIRIVDVLFDQNGNHWIIDENGFSIIHNTPFVHYSYKTLPYVWTINEDKDGSIWAASFGYGLQRSVDGIHFEKTDLVDYGQAYPYFLAASVKDDESNLYFGNASGLIKWDGHTFTNIFPDKPVYAVVFDQTKQHLILGGPFGVTTIDEYGQIMGSFDESKGLHVNDYIQNLSIDNDGNIWAGSYTGVSRIAHDLTTCENFTSENGRLPSAGVFCTYTDNKKVLWLGGDNGLLRYDTLSQSIISIQSHVLQSMVKSLTSISNSQLLIGAKDGLYVLNSKRLLQKNEVELSVFNQSNGYQGIEPGFTGFYHDSEDNIWISSASSVDKLKIPSASFSSQPLHTTITEINGLPIGFLDQGHKLQIDKGISDIQFNVDAIGFNRPQTVKFQYQIDNDTWSPWMEQKQFTINDLQHGAHQLNVRSGPTDLSQSDSDVATIEFSISLPFYKWQIFPFLAFTSAVLLVLIALFLYFRQRWENKKYIEQLTASKYLRSQLLLSELNPHFIFNILSSIQHKVLLGDRDQAAGYVVKLSKMIRNFLSASHHSHRSIDNYKENDISLDKEIELLSSYLEFEKMKSDDHFEYEINIDTAISMATCYVPPMLIQPFVENAIKHGLLLAESKGELRINISYFNEDLKIEIIDNGLGRQRAREKIGERKGHVSLGTLIIDQRIDLLNQLGYDLSIDTQDLKPTGTVVTIIIKE